MFFFITMYIHKSMIILCLLFDVVFGRSAILPDNVLFDHHVHSDIHDAAMRAF